ncbi:hypothetical protein B0H14DRAFT_2467657, partial [Mycena olivaceomarginata]
MGTRIHAQGRHALCSRHSCTGLFIPLLWAETVQDAHCCGDYTAPPPHVPPILLCWPCCLPHPNQLYSYSGNRN